MKRVLVSGASGFVGSNLARKLLKEGCQVTCLIRPDSHLWRIQSILGDVRLEKVDLKDAERLKFLLKEIKPDWVFHLAAHGGYSWQTDLNQIIESNIIGTVNLLQASLSSGFEALINTGSSSEYGYKNFAPTENECPDPNSDYAFAKTSASLYCRYIAEKHKLNVCTLRLYSVYGPFEDINRLIPTLILRGFKNELPRLVAPDIARDFIFIDDVVNAYILAAKNSMIGGSIYNVGTGIQTTLREIVDMAISELNISEKPNWETMPNRKWDTNSWVSNNNSIMKDLSWKPQFDISRGFRETIEWFKNNGEILNYEKSNTEH
ncbi:MAG: NAD-dependent epimerase/dehydratase family protein [Nitrospina sp.]|jgi:UDP-glucose 4-epimerase|nr:NAD-dependent epimerase/dehydratase family protein [Nitrospina sp.]MBT6601495.1 NAD-dependent epimerase/dehydratase family protein [Nitrospina sp.]